MRTESRRDQGPRSGTASQKVSSESADQVVVNYRTGAGPATAPWQSTTQQCWSDDRQPRRCKLPQDGAGGADQTRSRTRKRRDKDDDEQKVAVRREETNERERKARAETKNRRKRRSLQCVLGARSSNPIAAGDGRKRDSA